MSDASSQVTEPRDTASERINGGAAFHAQADEIPDNRVAEDMLDRAQVQLTLHRAMLGDARQPQGVQDVPVQDRLVESSCTRGLGVVVLPRSFLLITHDQPLAERSRHATRSSGHSVARHRRPH